MYLEGTSVYKEGTTMYQASTNMYFKVHKYNTKRTKELQKYMHVLDGNQASSLDKLGGLHLTRIGPSGMTQDSLTSNWLEWVSIDLTDRS